MLKNYLSNIPKRSMSGINKSKKPLHVNHYHKFKQLLKKYLII